MTKELSDWIIKDVETLQFELPPLVSWKAAAEPLTEKTKIAFVLPRHWWNYLFPFRRIMVFSAEIQETPVEDGIRLDVTLTSPPAYYWKFVLPWR